MLQGQNEHEKDTETKSIKGEIVEGKEKYFSTNCMRFTNSSSDPPTSKKSSTTVVSTPFFAHDKRASQSSGEVMVAAAEK